LVLYSDLSAVIKLKPVKANRATTTCLFSICLAGVFFSNALSARAQQSPSSKRKIIHRTAAPYPALARSLALAGTVKADVVVEPDGTVKSVDVRGGHPVLVQAAANCIRQWKWEPAPQESHEQVEIHFSPPE
jgi:TonB family protein